MFGVELKVVRAVFFPKPSPGCPRLRLGPDVPYLYSFVACSGLKFGSYPVDNIVCFVSTYPLDSDLSGG